MAPTGSDAGTVSVDLSAQFFGTIEFPDSVFPFLTNPNAMASMTIDMSSPHATTGSATISDGSNPFVLPTTLVLAATDGVSDFLQVRWYLIDSNSDLFHLTAEFIDPTGVGVVGSDLTSSVGGWTFSQARLDRGSDNVCCNFVPMDTGAAAFSFSAVPEPATMVLLSLGLAGLGVMRRKTSA